MATLELWCLLRQREKEKASSRVPFYKNTNPITKAPPSWPHYYLPKSPPPNNITEGLRFPRILWDGGPIFSHVVFSNNFSNVKGWKILYRTPCPKFDSDNIFIWIKRLMDLLKDPKSRVKKKSRCPGPQQDPGGRKNNGRWHKTTLSVWGLSWA